MNDINTLLADIKLRFNIDHPNFEECYAYGYECARAELGEEENPFALTSKESEQWLEGWWAGFYGEEPLYELSDYVSEPFINTTAVAANDQHYEYLNAFFAKVLEFSGIIAASALVGYQVLDLVA